MRHPEQPLRLLSSRA